MNKELNMADVINESFTAYAGAVLQSRALVDVRDCIKPSARQIFYCLYTDKFLPNKPFKKTLKAIGSAMRTYIHGRQSV
jgi:DNA gyrase/topoisomerase IV subunit A